MKFTTRVRLAIAVLAAMATLGFGLLTFALLSADSQHMGKGFAAVLTAVWLLTCGAGMAMARRLGGQAGADRMAVQVAHDIRSPLAALHVVAEHAHGLPADVRDLLRAAIARIHDMAQDLLQPGGRRLPALRALAVIDLVPLVHAAVAEKQMSAQRSKPVAIMVQRPGKQALRARVHRGDLLRALSNILNNAVEAHNSDAPVVVRLDAVDRTVRIRVADKGRGMSAAELQQVGARGYTRGKTAGHGLGLHQAKSSMRSCGGSVHIASARGKGTTVDIVLPQCLESENDS